MMRTLGEAEQVARAAIARRRSHDRAETTAQSAASAVRRLLAAQAVVDARRARQATVQAVLRTPRRLPIRAYPEWLAGALRDTPDDDREFMIWSDRW